MLGLTWTIFIEAEEDKIYAFGVLTDLSGLFGLDTLGDQDLLALVFGQ
jgi:hypothetical protein